MDRRGPVGGSRHRDLVVERAWAEVTTVLFRALIALRAVVLVYVLALNIGRFEEFARPGLAVADLVLLVGWTLFASWAYDAPRRRRLPLYVADLVVAVLLIVSTPLVQSQAMLDRTASTMPSFWVMTPVLAFAVGRHWAEAVVAAAVVSVSDLSVRTAASGSTWGNIFLLVLAASIVGYCAAVLRKAAEVRAVAERTAAAAEERGRLARAVHDGVLQVLGLVQRELSPRPDALADLGRLAGEQEARLRALVQDDARARTATRPAAGDDTADLMEALEKLGTPLVSVAGPATPVVLGRHQVDETAAAVGACLDNVRRHVGADAPAWVFVEDLGATVVVTVRDDGTGIPVGRLDEASGEGRLGVSGSIRGRLEELGGTAELTSPPGAGTEWELTVPRRQERP